MKRAKASEEFWRMVFANGGVSYTELKNMILSEYCEALSACLLWQREWSKEEIDEDED